MFGRKCCLEDFRFAVTVAILDIVMKRFYPYDMEVLFEEFKDCHLGDHLQFGSQMIMSILNVQITLVLSTKFQFNPKHYTWEEYHLNNFRMVTIAPSCILE